MLTGTYIRAIDEKRRVPIPRRLLESLPSKTGKLFVTPGTDGSLAIYAEEALAALAERLARASPAAEDVRAFSRLFYAQAQRVELDKQARIRIPPELAELAGLADEAVLLGLNDRLELWDKDRWNDYLSEKRPQYDQIAESAFGVGRPSVYEL